MTVPIYPGSIWVMAPPETLLEIAGWLHANMAEPRFVIDLGPGNRHPARSIAVAFANDEDEMLYALRWPEHYRRNSAFE